MHLLLADDDALARSAMQRVIPRSELAEWRVTMVNTAASALAVARNEHVDVVATDLHFTGDEMDGRDLVRGIRLIPCGVPILLYSAWPWKEGERVNMLREGADDVYSSPLESWSEFCARIQALARRGSGEVTIGPVRIGDLEVDARARVARVAGVNITLTRDQWVLLTVLVACSPRPALFSDLSYALGYGKNHDSNTLGEAIRRLRPKLAGAQVVIDAVPGVGYRLVPALVVALPGW